MRPAAVSNNLLIFFFLRFLPAPVTEAEAEILQGKFFCSFALQSVLRMQKKALNPMDSGP